MKRRVHICSNRFTVRPECDATKRRVNIIRVQYAYITAVRRAFTYEIVAMITKLFFFFNVKHIKMRSRAHKNTNSLSFGPRSELRSKCVQRSIHDQRKDAFGCTLFASILDKTNTMCNVERRRGAEGERGREREAERRIAREWKKIRCEHF